MQILIDIPEGLKKDFELEQWTALSCMEMKDALINGVILPKNHGDLIDANELKASMFCYMRDMTKSYEARYVMSVAKGLVDFQKPLVKADERDK